MVPSGGVYRTPSPSCLSPQSPRSHLCPLVKERWIRLAQRPSLELSLGMSLPGGICHPLPKGRTKLLAHLIFPGAPRPRPVQHPHSKQPVGPGSQPGYPRPTAGQGGADSQGDVPSSTCF